MHLVLRTLALPALAAASLLLITASSAHAATCTEYVKEIQIESNGKALVLFNNNTWHVLSSYTTPGYEQRVSLAVAAKLSGKRLYLSFTAGTCNATDYATEAEKVRLVD